MKITVKNLQKKVRIFPARIKKAVLKALSQVPRKVSGEITICFVNTKIIRLLNAKFLGKDGPTDVIAFGLSKDKRCLCGDIAVCADAALSNARVFKTTPNYELRLYAVHGLLHLLGYGDATAIQRKKMQAKADKIISLLE